MAENDESIRVTDLEIAIAMVIMGGSFVRILGDLVQHADAENLQRLKAAFPEYWEQYRKLAEMRLLQLRREADDVLSVGSLRGGGRSL